MKRLNDLEWFIAVKKDHVACGGVAQMVERSLSMREVPGSIPGISRPFLQILYIFYEMHIFRKYISIIGMLTFRA